MKLLRTAIFFSATAAAALLSGCAGHDTDYTGASVAAEPSHNLLGIVETNPKSYRYVEPSSTLILRTDELWGRRDFSGNNLTLFWGLINICDY